MIRRIREEVAVLIDHLDAEAPADALIPAEAQEYAPERRQATRRQYDGLDMACRRIATLMHDAKAEADACPDQNDASFLYGRASAFQIVLFILRHTKK